MNVNDLSDYQVKDIFDKFQIPLLFSNDEDFEKFITRLFNERFETTSFQRHGVSGQAQDGFDVFSTQKKIAIECKKKSIGRSDKEVKTELLSEFESKFLETKKVNNYYEFNTFILTSTFRSDVELNRKAAELKKANPDWNIEYWGMNKILDELSYCQKLKKEYLVLSLKDGVLLNLSSKSNKRIEAPKKLDILKQIRYTLEKFQPFGALMPNLLSNTSPFKKEDDLFYATSYDSNCLIIRNDVVYDVIDDLPCVAIDSKGNKLINDTNKAIKYLSKIDDIEAICNLLGNYRLDGYGNNLGFRKSVLPFVYYYNTNGLSYNIKIAFQRFEFNKVYELFESQNKRGANISIFAQLELAYINCAFGFYYKSLQSLKKIPSYKGYDTGILAFIKEYNTSLLSELYKDSKYKLEEIAELGKAFSSVDIEKILVGVSQPFELQAQMFWIKDETFIKDILPNLEEIIQNIEYFTRKGKSANFYLYRLNLLAKELVIFIDSNNLFYDLTERFSAITRHIVLAYFNAYSKQNNYYKNPKIGTQDISNVKFELIWMKIIVHYIDTKLLWHIVEDMFSDIKLYPQRVKSFCFLFGNLYKSFKSAKKIYKNAKKIHNYVFLTRYNRISSNSLILLSILQIPSNLFKELKPSIITFIKQALKSDFVVKYEGIEMLLRYEKKGCEFTKDELEEILNVVVEISEKTPPAGHPATPIHITNTILNTILTIDPKHITKKRNIITYYANRDANVLRFLKYDVLNQILIHTIAPSTTLGKTAIKNWIINFLNKHFHFNLYFHAVVNNIISYNLKNYFEQCLDEVLTYGGSGEYEFIDGGNPKVENLTLNKFIEILYMNPHGFTHPKVSKIKSKSSNYIKWLLNLSTYSYACFQPEWVLVYPSSIYTEEFKKHYSIKNAIKTSLITDFNPKVAEFYYQELL